MAVVGCGALTAAKITGELPVSIDFVQEFLVCASTANIDTGTAPMAVGDRAR
ncbi:hypothetical protein [Nocardia carnea]|uniref:Uncharacterized protein n=1 Tax=Nocardia carnea TaxID=37328 RepID=A0ABW7TXE4_9NOCA|nr:hypothetical protein [Nocardia carnea]